MKCLIWVNPVCPHCGKDMHFNISSVSCTNKDCEIFNKKFKRPTVILDEM